LAQDTLSGDFQFDFLKEYDRATDSPIPSIFLELDTHYPGSKFILTVRDPDEWIKSEENHHKRLSIQNFQIMDITKGDSWEKLCKLLSK